jgi:hypothetical protein
MATLMDTYTPANRLQSRRRRIPVGRRVTNISTRWRAGSRSRHLTPRYGRNRGTSRSPDAHVESLPDSAAEKLAERLIKSPA